MPITPFDPFGTMQRSRLLETEIQDREVHTAFDLFQMQQAMDQQQREKEYMRRTNPPPPQPGQPQGQQQQKPQPNASDMILDQIGKLDQNIGVAAGLGLNNKVEQLQKQREAMMGRYSLAKEREVQANDKIERERKDRIATVSRFASGANEILNDDKVPMDQKQAALEELESSIRDESPAAYRVLTGGKPNIDWGDSRTWARMRALEQQAIDPAKRVEMGLAATKAAEQKRRDDLSAKKTDALIAQIRETGESGRLQPGKRWANKEHTEMEDIPTRGSSAPKDLHGEDFLKALSEDEQGLIKGIADGRIDPKTLSTRGGHREDVLKKVAQYRPGFDQHKYAVYGGVMKSFTSGPDSNNVTGINTAIGHMGTMYEMVDALDNHDTRALNAILNGLAKQTGDPRMNNFEIAASAVSSELMRVFRGVGASEKEKEDWDKKFGHISSPEQLHEAIKTGAKLLKSRIEAVDDKWKRGMDSAEGYPNLLSPKSKAALKKIGVSTEEAPTSGSGKSEKDAMSLEDYVRTR